MPLVRKDPPAAKAQSLDVGALRTGAPEARRAAALAMTNATYVGALGEALAAEEEASVREAILSALVRIGSPEAAGVVAPGVRAESASVRRAALDTLRAMPEAAAAHVAALLQDNDPDVRLLTCEVARELPPDEATRLLCALLAREADINVCGAAVEVLADVGTADALAPLRETRLRFAGEPFLHFAIDTAIARIADTAGDTRG